MHTPKTDRFNLQTEYDWNCNYKLGYGNIVLINN